MKNKYLVIDFETAGLDPQSLVLSFAFSAIENNQIIKENKMLVRDTIGDPKFTTQEALNINKLDPKICFDTGTKFEEIISIIQNYINDGYQIVAQFAAFEKSFLDLRGLIIEKFVDTRLLSKIAFPNEEKHGLKDICERFKIDNSNHHEVLNDVHVTALALIKFIEMNIAIEATAPIYKR